jgi:hypothetical protein
MSDTGKLMVLEAEGRMVQPCILILLFYLLPATEKELGKPNSLM